MANKINKEEFKSKVLESDKPVLIDFYADWCGPCKAMAPIFDELSEEVTDVKFFKVDVMQERELAQIFEVTNIPTLIFIKDGEVIDKKLGARQKSEILDMISE